MFNITQQFISFGTLGLEKHLTIIPYKIRCHCLCHVCMCHYNVQVCDGEMEEKDKWNCLCTVKSGRPWGCSGTVWFEHLMLPCYHLKQWWILNLYRGWHPYLGPAAENSVHVNGLHYYQRPCRLLSFYATAKCILIPRVEQSWSHHPQAAAVRRTGQCPYWQHRTDGPGVRDTDELAPPFTSYAVAPKESPPHTHSCP